MARRSLRTGFLTVCRYPDDDSYVARTETIGDHAVDGGHVEVVLFEMSIFEERRTGAP